MPFLRSVALVAAASSAWAAPAPLSYGPCIPLEIGTGPVPPVDTPEAFQELAALSSPAYLASSPEGYVQAYKDEMFTYNEPDQFIDYVHMPKYDVPACAAACNSHAGCNAFTIFFERSPVVNPGPGCANPASTTVIKCDLWAGTITREIALNHGQMREEFSVVMAGSNAYVKDVIDDGSIPVVFGYDVEAYENGNAIVALLDCNNTDTYMGVAAFKDGRFDIARCIAACNKASATDAFGRHCRFMNTYLQRRDGVPFSQHCALYTHHWPKQYATNSGQVRKDSKITISETDSFGITDAAGDFEACLPKDGPAPVPTPSPNAAVVVTTITSTFVDIFIPTEFPVIPTETFTDWDPTATPVLAAATAL
ncbi:hypothetical protein EJ02DRAFT_202427 [Clathrospora elynae]|uniref:Apple domain-containing protein n=1 Tax=Clathrospora elynae TaxID=706981 RepID=A0A6A5SPL6_9PLEO|nr:hypothetical protein EJ02DRAFT_202427 [Clathrospora elynae]